MNTEELLRSRAERGTPRGAEAVWAEANRARVERPRGGGSRGPYRIALALAAALVLVVALAALDVVDQGRGLLSTPAADPEREPEDDELPLPDPVLVEGMDLDTVFSPRERAGGTTFVVGPPGARAATTTVYADADRPFEGPVVLVENLEGGGFRSAGANVDEAELEAMVTAAVWSEDGGWGLGPQAGLVEVARLEEDPSAGLLDGWQFNFSRGDERVTVQAEPGSDAGPWFWVARSLAGMEGRSATIEPVEVLGTTGMAFATTDSNQQIFWLRGDHVYRLTADRVDSDAEVSVPASRYLDRLQLADRAQWSAAVDDANSPSIEQIVGWAFQVVGLIILVCGGLFVSLAQRRWWLGGGALLAAFAYLALGPGTPLMAALLFVIGVAWLDTNGTPTADRQSDDRRSGQGDDEKEHAQPGGGPDS